MSVEVCLVGISPGIVRVAPGDAANVLANVAVVLLGPGEAYAGIPHEEWARRLGQEVDVEALRDEVARGLPERNVAAFDAVPGQAAPWRGSPLHIFGLLALLVGTIYFLLWARYFAAAAWDAKSNSAWDWRPTFLVSSALLVGGLWFLWWVLRAIGREIASAFRALRQPFLPPPGTSASAEREPTPER
jgi:hypothetical protein